MDQMVYVFTRGGKQLPSDGHHTAPRRRRASLFLQAEN